MLDYDDLLVLLRDALTDPVTGPAAAERVRSRYRVVMVDEFQDTDPVQWEILRTAFHGHRTLVLIGDPKQAIYALPRRGRRHVPARAGAGATPRDPRHRNWRSDAAVLAGSRRPARRDRARATRASSSARSTPARTGRRLRGAPGGAAATGHARGAGCGGRAANPPVGEVREFVYADVAAQVLRTPERGRRLPTAAAGDRLEPGDIAVLTRVNPDAVAVQRSPGGGRRAGRHLGAVQRVRDAGGPRLAGPALGARARPGVGGRVAAAALTPFVGWTASELAEASDDRRDELADRLRTWSRVLDDRGVAALLEATAADGLRRAAACARTDGERRLTDVRHVGEALHAAATDDGLGAAALLEWLRARIDEAGQDYAEERSRRLETDAAAVQVVTVHASKGLQFPVVLVPFLWDRYTPPSPATHRVRPGRRAGCCTSAARAARGTTTPARRGAAADERRGPAPRLRRADARDAARSSRGGRRRRTRSAAP